MEEGWTGAEEFLKKDLDSRKTSVLNRDRHTILTMKPEVRTAPAARSLKRADAKDLNATPRRDANRDNRDATIAEEFRTEGHQTTRPPLSNHREF